MSNEKLLSGIPEEFKYTIAKSLKNAIGDDIKEDIRRNRLDTRNNGDSQRVWDFINRNLVEFFQNDYDSVASKTQRGSWIMAPVFEKQTGTLVTLMRESRFKDLKGSVISEGNNSHYLVALTSCLNEKLIPESGEQTLFCFEEDETVSDEQHKIVAKILDDMHVPLQVVNSYAVVLFESKHYELLSLRCCVLDSSLNIIAQEDWSDYIAVSESVIVEQISVEDEIVNCPNRGISLKDKAIAKKGQKREYSYKKKEKENKTV